MDYSWAAVYCSHTSIYQNKTQKWSKLCHTTNPFGRTQLPHLVSAGVVIYPVRRLMCALYESTKHAQRGKLEHEAAL